MHSEYQTEGCRNSVFMVWLEAFLQTSTTKQRVQCSFTWQVFVVYIYSAYTLDHSSADAKLPRNLLVGSVIYVASQP